MSKNPGDVNMSNHKSLEYFIILGFSRETVPLGDIYGGGEGGIDWFYGNEWAHTVTEVDKSQDVQLAS